MSKTSRRAILGAAVAAGAMTGAAAGVGIATATAKPSALTERLERLVASYYQAHARWAPLMLSGHAAANDAAGTDRWFGLPDDERHRIEALFRNTLKENGCKAAAQESDAFHEEIEELAEDILDSPTRTIDDLWAKALIALFRAAPVHAGDTEFSFEEPEYEELVRAVAELAGRTAFVEAIEATFAETQS